MVLSACAAPTAIPTPTPKATSTLTATATATLAPTATALPTTPVVYITVYPPRDAIPAPKYDYGCKPADQCIQPDTSAEDAIVQTLYNEGSGDSIQLLADMLQVLQNEMKAAWTCSIYQCTIKKLREINPLKIAWRDIDSYQFWRLALFVLSQPYTINGHGYAAWNGWMLPLDLTKVETMEYKLRNYRYTHHAVFNWLDVCVGYDNQDQLDTCIFIPTKSGHTYRPQHPVCAANVLYMYETLNSLLGNGAPVVAVDKVDYGTSIGYVQFLTDAGAKYDTP